jgi:hypothetical protein
MKRNVSFQYFWISFSNFKNGCYHWARYSLEMDGMSLVLFSLNAIKVSRGTNMQWINCWTIISFNLASTSCFSFVPEVNEKECIVAIYWLSFSNFKSGYYHWRDSGEYLKWMSLFQFWSFLVSMPSMHSNGEQILTCGCYWRQFFNCSILIQLQDLLVEQLSHCEHLHLHCVSKYFNIGIFKIWRSIVWWKLASYGSFSHLHQKSNKRNASLQSPMIPLIMAEWILPTFATVPQSSYSPTSLEGHFHNCGIVAIWFFL